MNARTFHRTAAVAAVAAAALVLWLVTGAGGPDVVAVASILAQLAAPLLAAGACVARARRSRIARRAWLLLGASAGSWGAGQALWCWYELVARQDLPFPSAADAGYLGAVPLAVAGMLAFPAAPTAITSRLRTVFDGLIIGASLLFLAWAVVLAPLWSEGGDPLALVLGLAYPLGDVVIATIVVLVLGRGIERRAGPAAMLGPALLCLTVADLGFAYFTQTGTYASGFPTDAGWVAGYLLIGLAALRPEVAAPARSRRTLERGRVLLPYVPLGLAVVVGLATTPLGAPPDGFTVGIGLVLGVLVIARQLITLVENVALTRDLERTVQELRVRENELHHRAFHDPLTDLANRALFRDRVGHALTLQERSGLRVAVVFLDLDDFKAVNDALGHEAGDQLLAAVAERLRGVVRPMDTVARLGGDEFAVLLEDVTDQAQAEVAATRLCDALLHPFHLAGREVHVRGSLGIALAQHRQDADLLLRHADLAMYAAKAAGKARVQPFEAGMAASVVQEFELRTDLRHAVDADQLAVHYQPLMDLSSGRVTGFEALVRWRHPQRGLLYPADFLSLAEETGAIVPLGRWVLEVACAQLACWRAADPALDGAFLCVNLSPRQLADARLVDDVRRALTRTGLPAEQLVLELTEGMLVADDRVAVDRLRALKRLGIRLAIDDFGTGYSSLSYLRRFPLDVLKIDQAFVQDVDRDADDLALAKAIVQLGVVLGLATVAEGVERAGQAEAMRSIGCGVAQGYLFSAPLPAEEIPALLARLTPSSASLRP